MVDTSIDFLGVTFPNPLVLCSGYLGVTASTWDNLANNGAGGITTKSIWLKEHQGHPSPVVIANKDFVVNAVGLPDAGIEKAKIEFEEYLKRDSQRKKSVPLIVNIVGGKKQDFLDIATAMNELKPQLLEVNMSCPNVEDEHGKPFATSCSDAADLTRLLKEVTDVPMLVKLSPNVPHIAEVAEAVMQAGADGITAINTYGPGLVIDINSAQPILANKFGGVSGPGIKPLAVKAVFDIAVKTQAPIIGMGGITSGSDALEMMMAGASLVGLGSALYYRGQDAFNIVLQEMVDWCESHNVSRLQDVIGRTHEVLADA